MIDETTAISMGRLSRHLTDEDWLIEMTRKMEAECIGSLREDRSISGVPGVIAQSTIVKPNFVVDLFGRKKT